MILTPHAIVGATLANIFPDDPALGFGLAFVSHYVLDILPHTEYDIGNFYDKKTRTLNNIFKNKRTFVNFLFIVVDFIVAVILCVLLFVRSEKSAVVTFMGILGGLLPDFFQFMYFKFKGEPWKFYQNIHDKLHKIIKVKNEKFWGTFLQIIIPILILVIYFWVKR
jgi:SNF family Na+-dependent transporter